MIFKILCLLAAVACSIACRPVSFGPFEGTGRQMYRVPYSMRRYDSFGRCCICCNGGVYQHEAFTGNGLLTSCACNAYNYCAKARRIPDVPTRPQPQTTPSPELQVNNTSHGFLCLALNTAYRYIVDIALRRRYTQRQ